MEKDRRSFERVVGNDASAKIDFEGKTAVASVLDVSRNGMRICLPSDTSFPLKRPKVLVRDSLSANEVRGEILRARMLEDLTFEIALKFAKTVSDNVVAILSNDEKSVRMNPVGKTLKLQGKKLSGGGVMDLFRILKQERFVAIDVRGIEDSDSFGITFLTRLEDRGMKIVGANEKVSTLLGLWKSCQSR